MHLEKYRVYQEKSSPRRAYRILVEVALRLGHCYGKTFSGLLSISLESRLVSQVWQRRRQKLYKSATNRCYDWLHDNYSDRKALIDNISQLQIIGNFARCKKGLQLQKDNQVYKSAKNCRRVWLSLPSTILIDRKFQLQFIEEYAR